MPQHSQVLQHAVETERGHKLSWVFFTLVFGICKGAREGIKKKALEKSGTFEVLFLYTLLGFMIVIPTSRNVFDVPNKYYFFIFIKSFLVFLSWICSFTSIKHMPVGFYGVMDMTRVLFATLLGITVMGEGTTPRRLGGLALVLLGLILVNIRKKGSGENVQPVYIIMTVFSCLLAATSGVMDKWLTKTVTSSQLQFWYMLFMSLMYLAYVSATKTPVRISTLKTNYWIIILSVIFVIGDRALFIANSNPNSYVTVMTLIKQSSVIAAIIAGRVMFGEKGSARRILCALLIICGIMLAAV